MSTPSKPSAQAMAEAVREYQRQTTGTDSHHRHPFGLIFTDGMAFLAETCGAFWLLDLVASHQPDIRKRHGRDASFQVWRLRQDGEGWSAEAWSDKPESEGSTLFARQVIEFSDFPAELAPFEFYVEQGVALLKEER
jgi:hypothetical protein